MQERNFEKQVREKMDELSFVPSAPVWEKVEEQIRKKKEKRRFILWLFPLLIASGLGWWMIAENGLTHRNIPAQGTEQKKVTQQHQATPHDAEQTTPEFVKGAGNQPATSDKTLITAKETAPSIEGSRNNLADHQVDRVRKTAPGKRKAGIHPINDPALPLNDHVLPGTFTVTEPLVKAREAAPGIHPDLIEFNAERIVLSKTLYEKEISIKADELKNQTKTLNKWQFAITAQAGISGISEGFGNITRSAEMYFDASPSAPPTGSGFGNTPIPPPATPRSGFGFSAGFDVKRKLGNRWALASGLRYAYYSNTIQVGSIVYRDTAINRMNASILQTTAFYRNDDSKQDYNNQYHYLQVPISAEYKLGKQLPLFIQAGIKLEQLLSSNALFYNQYAGVYIKDKEMLAKTGLHLFTGLSYQFRSNKAFSFAVGPQFQYGITNLSKNKSNNQRLYFAGLSAQFYLKK